MDKAELIYLYECFFEQQVAKLTFFMIALWLDETLFAAYEITIAFSIIDDHEILLI